MPRVAQHLFRVVGARQLHPILRRLPAVQIPRAGAASQELAGEKRRHRSIDHAPQLRLVGPHLDDRRLLPVNEQGRRRHRVLVGDHHLDRVTDLLKDPPCIP